MKMNYQGKQYEFPEGASIEQINQFLGSGVQQTPVAPMTKEEKIAAFKDAAGIDKPSFGQNFVGGMLNSAKAMAQMVPDLSTMVPQSAQGALPYKQGERPIDQFAPYKLMGTQDQPFYTGQGAAQLAGELFAPGKVATNALRSGIPMIKKGINALSPGVESQKFMQSLGGGTATENAERVANTLETSAQNQKGYALAHKNDVMKEVGKNKVNAIPASELPEGNLQKVVRVLGKNPNDVTEEEAKKLLNSVARFRKHGDFEKFKDEAQDIFGSKELSENQSYDLEEMMHVPVNRDLNYLSDKNQGLFDKYGTGLEELHDKFVKNKSFGAAHELESALGKERASLQDRKKRGTIDTNGDNKLKALDTLYKSLRSDMETLVQDMPEHVQENWRQFKQKYRENYKPYESTTALRKIAKGETKGTKPETVTKIFAHPTAPVQKILKDLPQEGRNYIVYNELAHIKPTNAEAVINALNDMEQSGGFGRYITPEMKAAKKVMEKKLRNKNALTGVGSLGIIPGFKAAKNALKVIK